MPSPQTIRLYDGDWAAFAAWCGMAGHAAFPTAPAVLAAYLAAHRDALGSGTLARRRAAIRDRHRRHGLTPPPRDPAVTAMLGQARTPPARRRAPPPPAATLARMAAACAADLAGLRDRALLGLAAALSLPRAALVGLDVADIRFTATGVSLVVAGVTSPVNVARGDAFFCPVRALEAWLGASQGRYGPVFRKVDRWGNVEHSRLGSDAIRRILARRAL